MGKRIPDAGVIGQVYGRLTVLSPAPDSSGLRKFNCRCACGTKVIRPLTRLRNGQCQSCGCLRAEKLSKMRYKHGGTCTDDSHQRTFTAWVSMRERCRNPKNKRFHVYGARGISIDPAWDDFSVFRADMGLVPEGYSLERQDNNGPYCKENCHWLPRGKQSQNRQDTIWIRYEEQDWCFKRLCEYLEKPYLKTWKRYVLYGWTLPQALNLAVEEVKDLERITQPTTDHR